MGKVIVHQVGTALESPSYIKACRKSLKNGKSLSLPILFYYITVYYITLFQK